MSDTEQAQLIESVGATLYSLLPDTAVAITANIEADVRYSATELTVQRADGSSTNFGAGAEFNQPVDAINDAMIALRERMLEDTGAGFYGATITVERDGQFNVNFSYDPPED